MSASVSPFQEVVLASTSAHDTPILAWDFHTGSPLNSYAANCAPKHGMCAVGKDYFVASQMSRAAKAGEGMSGGRSGTLSFWTWRKGSVCLKSHPLELIGPVACTSDGHFLAGGSPSGRVYIWEVSTGRLLHYFSCHYKAVSALAFSDDDSLLLTGGNDAMIHVTPLIRILEGVNSSSYFGPSTSSQTLGQDSAMSSGGMNDASPGDFNRADRTFSSIKPMFSFNQHTQPITDLHVGFGGVNAILVSSSLDHTSKIFSLSRGTLLRSVVFPVALSSICVDPAEYCLYAGGHDGNIYVTSLNYGVFSSSSLSSSISTKGAGERRANEDGVEVDPTAADDMLSGHQMSVTSLRFSLDGVTLLSASEDGSILFWDTHAKQMLRSLKPGKGPIFNLLVLPRPPSLSPFSPHLHQSHHLLGNFPSLSPSLASPLSHSSSSSQPLPSKKASLSPLQELRKFPNQKELGVSGSETWEEAPVILSGLGPSKGFVGESDSRSSKLGCLCPLSLNLSAGGEWEGGGVVIESVENLRNIACHSEDASSRLSLLSSHTKLAHALRACVACSQGLYDLYLQEVINGVSNATSSGQTCSATAVASEGAEGVGHDVVGIDVPTACFAGSAAMDVSIPSPTIKSAKKQGGESRKGAKRRKSAANV